MGEGIIYRNCVMSLVQLHKQHNAELKCLELVLHITLGITSLWIHIVRDPDSKRGC